MVCHRPFSSKSAEWPVPRHADAPNEHPFLPYWDDGALLKRSSKLANGARNGTPKHQGVKPHDFITQAELVDAVALVEHCRRLTLLREGIVKRLAGGAQVERGPLNAQLLLDQRTALTWNALATAFARTLSPQPVMYS
jgi:hypothetical protein